MKKRNAIMAVLVIITMCLAATLGAQTSSQKTATAEVFGNNVDKFMNVNKYTEIGLENWFGYMGVSNGILELGYAKQLGGLYLSLFYKGNILDKISNSSKTLKTEWNTNLQTKLSEYDGEWYDESNGTTPSNNFNLLIGVANMGFKLGFDENYTFYDAPYNANRTSWSGKNTNIDGSVNYWGNDSISYDQTKGYMTPAFDWGMRLDLGDSKILMPRLGAKLKFASDELVDEYYTNGHNELNGNIVGPKNITKKGQNNGYMDLTASAGVTFYTDSTMYIAVDYVLGMGLYDQGLNQAGGGATGSVEGFVSWVNNDITETYIDRTKKTNTVSVNVDEKSSMSHTITPAFWKQLSSKDDVKFGIYAKVPVYISSSSSNKYTDTWGTEETTYNDANLSSQNEKTTTRSHTSGLKTETSTLSINPSVGIGLSYALIPGKFTVNAGATIKPVAYTTTTTTKANNGLDSTYIKVEKGSGSNLYTDSETSTVSIPDDPDNAGQPRIYDDSNVTTNITGLRGDIGAGFTVNFNENFTLDLAVKTDSTARVVFSVKY